MPKVNNIKTEDITPNQLKKLYEAIEQDENKQAANDSTVCPSER